MSEGKSFEKLDDFFNQNKVENQQEEPTDYTEYIEGIKKRFESGVDRLAAINKDNPRFSELLELMMHFASNFEGMCWKGEKNKDGSSGDLPQTPAQMEKFMNSLEDITKKWQM